MSVWKLYEIAVRLCRDFVDTLELHIVGQDPKFVSRRQQGQGSRDADSDAAVAGIEADHLKFCPGWTP